MGIQIREIFLHALSLAVFHLLDDLAINLQQPESGRDIFGTDDEQVDAQFLGFHLCILQAVVDVPFIQAQERVQLQEVPQRIRLDTHALPRHVEENEHRIASAVEGFLNRKRIRHIGIEIPVAVKLDQLK